MSPTPSDTVHSRARVEYEPQLIEEAVRSALESGTPGVDFARLVRLRFENRRRLEKLYALPHGAARETAFRRHFWKIFRALRLDKTLAGWLETFPQLATSLECILVSCAHSRADEGAELWESREHQGCGIPSYLVVAIQPAGLSQPGQLRDRVLPALQEAVDRVASPPTVNRPSPEAGAPASASSATRCPLCRFPTTEWATPELLNAITPPVEADFPDWSTTDGCCAHCGERYEDLASPEMAPSPY